MSIIFERNDISKVKADVIVNSADPKPQIGRGVDSSICKAAGKDQILDERKKNFKSLKQGEVGITKAYSLSAKEIFHIVDPVKHYHAPSNLCECYVKCLELAINKRYKSIAFPVFGAGHNIIADEYAIKFAFETCSKFMSDYPKYNLEIIIVVFGSNMAKLVKKAGYPLSEITSHSTEKEIRSKQYSDKPATIDVSNASGKLESYHDMFMNTFNKFYFRCRETVKSDSVICDNSNLCSKTFSTIKNGQNTNVPSRNSIIALIFGLKLTAEEGKELLKSAGMSVDVERNNLDHFVFESLEKGLSVGDLNELLVTDGIGEIIGTDTEKKKASASKINANKKLATFD